MPDWRPHLKQEYLDQLNTMLNWLKWGSWCTVIYTTKTGRNRTVHGAYQGVEQGHAILHNNGRNNRVPVESVMRWSVSNDIPNVVL